MKRLLVTAFGIQEDQFSGPDWVMTNDYAAALTFDIVAKLPPGTTKEQANVMLRKLLAERFNLTVHTEKKDFEVYALMVTKGGPKLKPAAPADGPAPPPPSPGEPPRPFAKDQDGFPVLPAGYPNIVGLGSAGHKQITARMETTTVLLGMLGIDLGTNHLVDKTGLTDKYDFKLAYSTAGLPRPAVPARVIAARAAVDAAAGVAPSPIDNASDPAPDLFAALEKQLGLKLEKSKAPMDVVVIDHIEKTPTEN
jgi:uncharacterized protein (TIGR03435 family)